MVTDSNGERRKSKWVKRLFIALLLIFLAYAAFGCEVWREIRIKISAKNSRAEVLEVLINEDAQTPLLGPGEINAYRTRVIARGTNPNYYGMGPSHPQCTDKVHVSARVASSSDFLGTVSFGMCQDQEVLVDFTPTQIIVFGQSGSGNPIELGRMPIVIYSAPQ